MKKLAPFLLAMVISLSLAGCGDRKSSNDDPFGHLYCVGSVLQGEAPDTVLIQLNEYHSLSICEDVQTYDYSMIGNFETVEENGDPLKGPWQLFADETQTERYCLELEENGTVMLSYAKHGELQWKYQLRRADLITCDVTDFGSLTTIYLDWLYPDTFSATPDNLIYLSGADISGKGTVKLTVQDASITSLTVYEAYYTDGNVEHNQYVLADDFRLSVSTRYASGEQFAIYRIPCGELDCWFYLDFD